MGKSKGNKHRKRSQNMAEIKVKAVASLLPQVGVQQLYRLVPTSTKTVMEAEFIYLLAQEAKQGETEALLTPQGVLPECRRAGQVHRRHEAAYRASRHVGDRKPFVLHARRTDLLYAVDDAALAVSRSSVV